SMSHTEMDHNYGQSVAEPLHVQKVENALRLEPFLNYLEKVVSDPVGYSDGYESSDSELDVTQPCLRDGEGNKLFNGITITKAAERKADKTRLYNFTKVKKGRKWLKNILLSDSSSDEDDKPITEEDFQTMLKIHKYQRKHQIHFYQDNELHQYQYYSTGMLSNIDKYYEQQKAYMGTKKKISKEHRKKDKKLKDKLSKLKKERLLQLEDDECLQEADPAVIERYLAARRQHEAMGGRMKKLTPEQADVKRKRIWITIAKKEIPKAQKQTAAARKEMLQSLKKISQQAMRECRKAAIQSQKTMKECQSRAKRLSREMLSYWKRFEKVEKEHRKRAEKEAQEQRKMDLELREAKRQQRKLNFLITQTELYAHFMARKLTGANEESKQKILRQLEEPKSQEQVEIEGRMLVDVVADEYDAERLKNVALKNAEDAYRMHQSKRKVKIIKRLIDFDKKFLILITEHLIVAESSLANPTLGTEADRPQPSMFEGVLKTYQLKGMNWLANLYDQGINGILADEMGLGKTVQSMAFLAHLAEAQGIWGPFLVIAPASTLHNWQQECARFVPKFKIVPYWGNTQDRKILRKFWDQKCLHTEEASFHVVITSYQLVIQDVKYFQRIKWQYMILDEAQAIKSSSSVRWKILLGFNCRNRLLLTGTPIQNSMAELWALLHFIMPTMFDSHDEFNEWFSKDIESHAEKQSGIDENQLSRLHMILKPFMLRRVKKDVENELSDKIEILVYCPLTRRQKMLYQGIKNKISIEDLLQGSSSNTSQAQNSTSSLMNLVMQFRKVCNHSELFERRESKSPFFIKMEPYTMPKLIYREGLVEKMVETLQRTVYNTLYIHNPEHVHRSLSDDGTSSRCFSFTRFTDMSPKEIHDYMAGGLLVRWLAVFLMMKEAYRIYHSYLWTDKSDSVHLHNKAFILEPLKSTYFPSIQNSTTLTNMVFASPTSTIYTFKDHSVHYMAETQSHRLQRARHHLMIHPGKRKAHTPPTSPTKSPISPTRSPTSQDLSDFPVHKHIKRPSRTFTCQPTVMPKFMYYSIPKIQVPPQRHYCSDRSAAWDRMKADLCGTPDGRLSMLYGTPDLFTIWRWYNPWNFFPSPSAGMAAFRPTHGWSNVFAPDKESLVTDAGKLSVLDTLLLRLKSEGHRVLIYSQMTRMIDLLEEYMWHRKHTYMRLDGSSKISDRRDMVANFQARSDIFVFLLSTRAGGLGINLTAADTVIFYDSDWNPTVDQQAMDRAHRLGQTKQVTVYRLVCKGTIEERILQRAKEKSEIQRMVISGGNYRTDILKPKEVVSLLLDDDEMEKKLKQRQDRLEDGGKDKEKKRKREYKRKDGKKSKTDDVNVTIQADTESLYSIDSTSMPASPLSVVSYSGELTNQQFAGVDDSSNDGLVIVDDSNSLYSPGNGAGNQSTRGKRGRPKGSTGRPRRPRGRGSVKKALSAAELAGAQAAMTAAYAAYGYNLASGTPPSSSADRASTESPK
ncbi:hypothetical protein FSP39_020132, partial [Pinctada imbricata]